jgi:hypothetical protein
VAEQDEVDAGMVFIDPAYAPNLGVLLHEAGHIAGLNHVNDPNQVMYQDPRKHTKYASGDKAGLFVLSQQCKK